MIYLNSDLHAVLDSGTGEFMVFDSEGELVHRIPDLPYYFMDLSFEEFRWEERTCEVGVYIDDPYLTSGGDGSFMTRVRSADIGRIAEDFEAAFLAYENRRDR